MILLMIGTGELLLIALLALLLFGGKKLPELMRGLGSGVKNFKEGMNGITANDKPEEIKSETVKPDEIKVSPTHSEVIDAQVETIKEEKTVSDGSK